MNPVPGSGQMLKAARTAERVVEGARAADHINDARKGVGSLEAGAKAINGNSRFSDKARYLYEIRSKATGEVVKTGVSGGKINGAQKSVRAEKQVKKLGWDECESPVIAEIPVGPGARMKILEMKRNNAEGLRAAGQLMDRTKHVRP